MVLAGTAFLMTGFLQIAIDVSMGGEVVGWGGGGVQWHRTRGPRSHGPPNENFWGGQSAICPPPTLRSWDN